MLLKLIYQISVNFQQNLISGVPGVSGVQYIQTHNFKLTHATSKRTSVKPYEPRQQKLNTATTSHPHYQNSLKQSTINHVLLYIPFSKQKTYLPINTKHHHPHHQHRHRCFNRFARTQPTSKSGRWHHRLYKRVRSDRGYSVAAGVVGNTTCNLSWHKSRCHSSQHFLTFVV